MTNTTIEKRKQAEQAAIEQATNEHGTPYVLRDERGAVDAIIPRESNPTETLIRLVGRLVMEQRKANTLLKTIAEGIDPRNFPDYSEVLSDIKAVLPTIGE